MAPRAPKIIIGITEIRESPFWEAKKPAVGNTANVGIGGIIVSSNAAKKTPSYRYKDKKSPIQTINESKGSNKNLKLNPTKLLYRHKENSFLTQKLLCS